MVSEEKSFEIVDGRTTDDGRTTEPSHPISSPGAFGSGELKTYGITNRRRPIFNPTIQLVVVNLYTKYEVSILNGCGDIFDEKSGEKEKGTNKRKNK